jgi:hypothetical protein
MYSTIEHIAEIMTEENLPYYTLADKTGKHVFSKNYDSDNVQASISKIEKVLAALVDTDAVKLSVTNVNTAGRKGLSTKEYDYLIKLSGTGQFSTISQPAESNAIKELRDEIRRLEIQNLQADHKRQLEDLRRDLEDKQRPDVLAWLKEINGLINLNAKKVQPVAAPVQQPINKSRVQHATDLVSKWAKLDPEFYLVVESIVNIIETQPDQYEQYKAILTSKDE